MCEKRASGSGLVPRNGSCNVDVCQVPCSSTRIVFFTEGKRYSLELANMSSDTVLHDIFDISGGAHTVRHV